MVSALDSGSSGPPQALPRNFVLFFHYLKKARHQIGWSRFEPWPGHCIVSLGKTLYSHSASFHPDV